MSQSNYLMISSRAFVFSFLKNYLNSTAIAAFPVAGEAEEGPSVNALPPESTY